MNFKKRVYFANRKLRVLLESYFSCRFGSELCPEWYISLFSLFTDIIPA